MNSNVIEAVAAEIDRQQFVALAVYVSGVYTDTIVQPVTDGDTVERVSFDKILDVLLAHDIITTELRTDSEAIYKAVIQVAGIGPRLVPKRELSVLYRLFDPRSPEYEIIRELDTPKMETPAIDRVSVLKCIIEWIRNLLIKRRDNR